MADTPSPSPTPPSPLPPAARLHLWQIQWVRDLMLIAAIFGVIYLGYQIRLVSVPLLLALALAYLFEPLVRWLRDRRLCSRRVAAGGIILGLVLLFAVPLTIGAGFAAVQGTRAISELAADISKVQRSLEAPDDEALRANVPEGAWLKIRDTLAARAAAKDRPPSETPAPPQPAPVPVPSDPAATPTGEEKVAAQDQPSALEHLFGESEMRELGQRAIAWLNDHAAELSATLGRRVASSGATAARAAFATAATVGTLLLQLVLTAMFFFFLSTNWDRVLAMGDSFIPHTRRERVLHVLRQMDRAIAGFVRGRVTICAILAGYYSIVYWLAGVPMPLLLGPIVGLMCIVPYVQLLGVFGAMLMMWIGGVHGPIFAPEMFAGSGGLWWILIAPPVIHVAGNAFDDYVLTPAIQGKHTELAVPTIVFASIAGGALAGIYGLLVAIPVAACLRILMKEVFWPRLAAWVRGEAKDMLPIGKE